MKNLLYGSPRLLFYKADSRMDPNWARKGISDLHHLPEKMRKHESSRDHIDSCTAFALLGLRIAGSLSCHLSKIQLWCTMFFTILMIFVVVNMCASYDNSSGIYDEIAVLGKSVFSSHQSRLISFNTLDDGISVELDFSVPFITIPVKKSMALAQGSLVNIDVGAVILAGGLVVGISLLMPIILGFFSKQLTYPSQWKPDYRNSEGKSEMWSHIESLLSANKIDPTSCMQKYICSAISKSLLNIKDGRATSSDKIIDGIVSSEWLTEQLHGTSIYFALKNGLDRTNCTETYKTCGLSENLVETVFDAFQKLVLFAS